MASNLVEVAKAVGGDEELIEKAAAIEGRFQAIKEMASEEERKNLAPMDDEETTNGRIPLADHTNFEDFESEPVEQSSNHSSGRTVTEGVEIPGPGRSMNLRRRGPWSTRIPVRRWRT